MGKNYIVIGLLSDGMSRYVDEEKSRKLNGLLELLKSLNLDFNWLMAVASLSAQEIAIKKKLDELGVSYGEEDFQKLVKKLIDSMEKRELEVPHILLSVARSYRHIRAKILHRPRKIRLSAEEADAIFYNTEALIRTLFKEPVSSIDISKFIDSINKLSVDRMVKEFHAFSKEIKKQIFEAILDKLSLLKWDEIRANEGLFEFLRAALKVESNITLRNELFDILLTRTLIGMPFLAKEKLLTIIAEFTRLSSIREFIRENKRINQIITEFEMSNSFAMAAINAEIILNLASLLDKEQVNRVIDAALSNDQIFYSWGARSSLRKFLSIHRDRVPEEKADKLLKS